MASRRASPLPDHNDFPVLVSAASAETSSDSDGPPPLVDRTPPQTRRDNSLDGDTSSDSDGPPPLENMMPPQIRRDNSPDYSDVPLWRSRDNSPESDEGNTRQRVEPPAGGSGRRLWGIHEDMHFQPSAPPPSHPPGLPSCRILSWG